jgi:hypothetical protein
LVYRCITDSRRELWNVDLITVRFAAWRFCSYVLKKSFA